MLQLHEKPRECPDLWGQIVIGKGIINLTRHGKKWILLLLIMMIVMMIMIIMMIVTHEKYGGPYLPYVCQDGRGLMTGLWDFLSKFGQTHKQKKS